ncbi:MAG: zinc ribbon domain-containing protein, partial [Clostridiales bacterium]|nr:zinc ribbon domain-containing protein [Clostridiales bacterium]
MAKKCPACNADNKDGALVCEYCGTRLSSDKPKSAEASEETRFCSSCGKPLAPDAAFCPFCGAKRNGSTPEQVSAVRQVPIPPRTPVSQGLPDYMQPGYQQRVRAEREAERQAAKNASKTKKSTRGLSLFLSLLLAAQVCVAAFRYPGFLRGKIGGTQGKTDGESSSETGEFGDALADLLDMLGMTEEDLAGLAEIMPTATAENSPGNPAFYDVTFTEAEYAAAKTLTAPVSWESPEADFPEFGIHVNMKPWNLEYEEDTLTVKQMPVKDDPVTGARLYIYDYSLASGQHEFLTDVEITAPVVGDDFYGFVVFNEDTGKWESAYCELSEDGKT